MVAQFTNQPLLSPELRDRFKYEIAEELGVLPQIENGYWGNVSARDCGRCGGRIGGNMVKIMIKCAEEAISNGS